MENRGLLFIPDISGFTKFVTEMEIDHSRHIIEELLEILINANNIGLEISEIEGDAILFYKYGDPPDLKTLYQQVEKMFCEFHRHITAYEYRRLCQCKACRAAVSLTLKVVTHYGEFTGYNVKNFSKLIGKDVIVAHQLLKNDIDQHEYWLVTKNLLQDKPLQGFKQWMTWDSSAKKTETGEIPFQYTQLTPLKDELPPSPPLHMELKEKKKMISVYREYEVPLNKLFFSAGHFELRHRWQEGVKAVDQVSHYLPRVGTKHRCVLENGQVIMYTSSFSFGPEKIVYAETDEKKRSSTYFIFEKINDNRTRFTIDFYLKKDPLLQIIFKLTMKKKLEHALTKSLSNLEQLVKEIELPVEF
ncbi:MAG TPA: DUF2652 domain-containing protein [Chitinophagaceae bacterium]|jgi:hypothetical protein|nr:DUF2652 domain-containing protein [Chitinophagaceae bacterium]